MQSVKVGTHPHDLEDQGMGQRAPDLKPVFVALALCLASGLVATGARPVLSRAGTKARVVVIGGGFGGATCAKYLRRADPSLDVTLVTPQRHFISCPFSNAVVTGLQPIASITNTYYTIRRRYGIRLL